MIVLLLTGLLAILFAHLQSNGKLQKGLQWGMAIVTFIAAIHWNFGSDYMNYFESFISYNSNKYSIKNIIAGGTIVHEETGWALLYWLFGHLGEYGFYLLIAFISVMQGVVVYKLIVKYVPNEWLAFAVFVYTFNLSLYVGSLSGIRQHFAMVIVGMSLPYIINKRPVIPILLVLAASTIHTSAIVFLPFTFFGVIPPRGNKIVAIMLVVLFIIFFINKDLVQDIFDGFFINEKLSIYEELYGYNESNLHFGFGFVINMIPFILSLYYLWTCNTKEGGYNTIVALSAIGFIIIPFKVIIPLASRIAYYFDFFSFISLPIIYNHIKYKSFRNVVLALYVLIGIYSYISYFYSDLRYATTFCYHSIFELLLK